MRRSVVVLTVVAAVLAVVAVALATALVTERDDRPGYAGDRGSMMADRDPGDRGGDDGGGARGRGWDDGDGAPYGPRGGPGGGFMGGFMGGAMGDLMGGHAAVDSEHAWLVDMVAHHEEAIEAAGELARSRRPEMRAFGERIVRSQSAQVEQMRDWLVRWYPRRPLGTDYEPMMRDLSGLSGDDLDRAFLRDMVPHHMAAVMMSQQLLVRDLARHDEVERLAASIRDEQHAEIVTMTRWLRAWPR